MRSLFPADRPWPVWQLFLFRVIFIFLILMMDPVDWFFGLLRFENPVYNAYDATRTKIVTWANDHFFHIRPVLVQPAGSGDTSFVWAFVCCVICVTAIGAVIWSLADRHRAHYRTLGYWFRNYLRYYLIMFAVIYGLAKITLSQMGTLNLVDLSTAVGDLSPMRMCWYFIAASPPYQIFSGLMEMTVAVLLLYRRTVTLGLLTGLAVFSNVMMLNFTYDICVKIFSAELVLAFIVLLFRDYERLAAFLLLNRPAGRNELYDPVSATRSFRVWRIVLKSSFLITAVAVPLWLAVKEGTQSETATASPVVPSGVYDLARFTRNGDSTSLPERRWTRLVLDRSGSGMLQGDSTLFRYNYGHSVFNFKTDKAKTNTLLMYGRRSKNPADPVDSAFLHYEMLSPGLIRFRTRVHNDSLQFDARLTAHRFRLNQWQFHWVSEYTP